MTSPDGAKTEAIENDPAVRWAITEKGRAARKDAPEGEASGSDGEGDTGNAGETGTGAGSDSTTTG